MPFASGIEINLDRKERSPQAHAEADEKDERPAFDQDAQGIKGKQQEGDPRRVKGIAAAGLAAGADIGTDLTLEHHETGVIPLLVVIGQVEVPVPEQAVTDQEVMGFVTAEAAVFPYQEQRSGVKGQERAQAEEGDPFLG